MAQQDLNLGALPDDGTGDPLRLAGQKIQGNFDELYTLTASHTATFATLGTAATKNTGTGAGNVPVLDGSGLLDTAVLPALSISDVFTVASQVAMLALTAQRGDVAVRSDLNKSFILSTNSPSTLADWKELLTPTDAVLSVAALTGAITAAALKTALAIAVADITDASANGRSLIAAANYAAMRVLLNISQNVAGNSQGVKTPTGAATRYLGTILTATETDTYYPIGIAGTFKNLRVVASDGSPGPVGEKWTITVRKTLVDTTLTCDIISGVNTGSDLTHTVHFAAGDRFCLKIVSTSGVNLASGFLYSLEFIPD